MDYYNYGVSGITPLPNVASQPQMQASCPLDNRFAWVQNKDQARSYPMSQNKTILFLNENDAYAYLRRTDNTGKTVEFRIFKLEEEQEPEPEVTTIPGNMVTRNEFETFSKNIDTSLNELKDMILASRQNNYNKDFNKNKQKAGDH